MIYLYDERNDDTADIIYRGDIPNIIILSCFFMYHVSFDFDFDFLHLFYLLIS